MMRTHHAVNDNGFAPKICFAPVTNEYLLAPVLHGEVAKSGRLSFGLYHIRDSVGFIVAGLRTPENKAKSDEIYSAGHTFRPRPTLVR